MDKGNVDRVEAKFTRIKHLEAGAARDIGLEPAIGRDATAAQIDRDERAKQNAPP
jgi:hypothetical protein